MYDITQEVNSHCTCTVHQTNHMYVPVHYYSVINANDELAC